MKRKEINKKYICKDCGCTRGEHGIKADNLKGLYCCKCCTFCTGNFQLKKSEVKE